MRGADEPTRHGDARPPVVPAPTRLRFEHQPAGAPAVGLGHRAPRLSWQLPSAPDRYVQGAYQVEVSGSDRPTQSATVASRDQVLVPWPVEPLRSRERVAVRIRVRPTLAEADGWSDWSPAAIVEAGLLAERDWIARFVSPRRLGGLGMPAPVLRGVLQLPPATVRSARLYVTALGCYVPSLNGERVGDHVLAPGWTSDEHTDLLPDLRCHAPIARRGQHPRSADRQRLVSRRLAPGRTSPVRPAARGACTARGRHRRRTESSPCH